MTATSGLRGADTGTPFNCEHCIKIHLPFVRKLWGPCGLERVGGFLPKRDGAGLIATAHCVLQGDAALQATLFSPETTQVMAGIDLGSP